MVNYSDKNIKVQVATLGLPDSCHSTHLHLLLGFPFLDIHVTHSGLPKPPNTSSLPSTGSSRLTLPLTFHLFRAVSACIACTQSPLFTSQGQPASTLNLAYCSISQCSISHSLTGELGKRTSETLTPNIQHWAKEDLQACGSLGEGGVWSSRRDPGKMSTLRCTGWRTQAGPHSSQSEEPTGSVWCSGENAGKTHSQQLCNWRYPNDRRTNVKSLHSIAWDTASIPSRNGVFAIQQLEMKGHTKQYVCVIGQTLITFNQTCIM